MKIVHRYILSNFLKKFIPSFIIIFFILVIQLFWLYFDELAGKGLGGLTILKFLMYLSPSIILNDIPLAILLGGIMSFGSLSEKSEFTAMKSMGISLVTMMKSLSVFIVILAIGSFIFANTALPYGNYKFSNLRRNIHKKMPSIAISEGVFNDFKPAGINIYVKEKYGENNNKLKEVVIHQKVNGIPDKVIIAKRGLFLSDPKNQLIQLILYDGAFYEDLTRQQKNVNDRKKHPAMKSAFKEHIINIDVSAINKVDLSKETISSAYSMLNVMDLKKQIDTIAQKTLRRRKGFSTEILKRLNVQNIDLHNKQVKSNSFATSLNDNPKITTLIKEHNTNLQNLYTRAVTKTDGLLMLAKRKQKYFENQQLKANKYIHSLNEKFTYPLAVLIMFLVGVPLGAIIRKGGFGISVVFGIVIFVTYYILSMLGKNAAEEGAIPPYLGAWLSTAVLLPLGLYLSYKAHNDGELNTISNIFNYFKNLFLKLNKTKSARASI